MNRARHETEAGITLVELLVYSMLLILVLFVVAGLFTSAFRTSANVRTVTGSATEGQLVADSVETGIRNSSDFRLTLPNGDDQMVVARVIENGSTVTWSCVAWYYSAAGDGSIRYTRSSGEILAPLASDLLTWTLLDEGIRPVTGTTIFSAAGGQLMFSFQASAGSRAPTIFSSSAFSRAGASGSLTCF